MRRWKIVLRVGIGILILAVLVQLLASPLAKFLVERNSVSWTGRQVRVEQLRINMLTGSLHAGNIRVMESNADTEFLVIGDLFARISVRQLLSGTYVLEELRIRHPIVHILQRGNHLNVDDLLQRFAESTTGAPKKFSGHYLIQDIRVDSATVRYRNTLPEATIDLTGMRLTTLPFSDMDTAFQASCDFDIVTGGRVQSRIRYVVPSKTYRLWLKADTLNLAVFLPYLKDYLHVASLTGHVNADLSVAGNAVKRTEIAASGAVHASGFSIVDTTNETLVSVSSFDMGIDSIDTRASLYNLRNLSIDHPAIRFGIYRDGYNFERILTSQATDTATVPVEDYSNVFRMIAGYLRLVSAEYRLEPYRINRLAIQHGQLVFTDYTLEEKFTYHLDSIYVTADHFYSDSPFVKLRMGCRLNRSGSMNGVLSVDPHGYQDMDIAYEVQGLLITDINPYSRYYTATSFLDGVMTYSSQTTIRNKKLKSENHVLIEHVVAGKKSNHPSVYHVPVRMAVSLMRDSKGNIELDVPVEGDLSDPKFRVGKVVWDVLGKMISKVVKAPFRLLANAFGGKEEDYREVPFDYLQRNITHKQVRALTDLSSVLKSKPGINLEMIQENNRTAEKEQWGIFLAKARFLGLDADSLAPDDQKAVDGLSGKDSLFLQWVDGQLPGDQRLTSVEEKCMRLAGKEKLDADVQLFMERRNAAVLRFMTEKGISAERLQIHNATDESEVTRKTIPHYRVSFLEADTDNAGPGAEE